MTLRVLDPRQSAEGEPLVMAPPLPKLEGAVVGLLDNAKIGTATFYDHVERLLKGRGVREVVRRRKGDSSRPAPEAIIVELSAADAVVSGICD